jgi:hypothetical protein
MVTTNRLIHLEAFGSDPPELVHLTGFFQVLARVTMGDAGDLPAHVELCFDAARVRGVGLKTGARYWVEEIYQSRHQPGEFSAPFDVVSRFELRRCAPDGSQPAQLALTVCFRVTVPGDGRVTVTAGDVELMS